MLGLIVGVAVGGGGICARAHRRARRSSSRSSAGAGAGALALAIAARPAAGRSPPGRRGVALLGFLVNGFAPLVSALEWLKYLSLFYYYEGHDPIANGVDAGDLAVLAAATIALTALASGRHAKAGSSPLARTNVRPSTLKSRAADHVIHSG